MCHIGIYYRNLDRCSLKFRASVCIRQVCLSPDRHPSIFEINLQLVEGLSDLVIKTYMNGGAKQSPASLDQKDIPWGLRYLFTPQGS